MARTEISPCARFAVRGPACLAALAALAALLFCAQLSAEIPSAFPSIPSGAEAVDSSLVDTATLRITEPEKVYVDPDEAQPRLRRGKHARRAGGGLKFKSDIWLPLPSVVLPGFGQYFQGDWTGAVYTGVAVGGLLLYATGAHGLDESADQAPPALFDDNESWTIRRMLLGAMAYQGSGLVSAYSAFRISVPRFQQEDGRYRFLKANESIGDVMASPFRFRHLKKATSYVPLGLLAGAVGGLVYYKRHSHRGADWLFSGDDLAFYGPLAYNAGITEEAAFRGWLLPLAYEYSGETWWLANGAQALFFAGLHYSSDNPVPWPQALLGYYFGYLTRKNQWTLSEAIFVHTWWDALLFVGGTLVTRRSGEGTATFRVDLPMGW